MKDRKLLFKALGLWWLTCFIAIAILPELFYAFAAGKDFFEFCRRTLIVAGISAVIAVPVDLFLFFAVFMRHEKYGIEFIKLLRKVQKKEMNAELLEEMQRHYDLCAAKQDIYGTYFNTYAILLGGYYSDMGDCETALRYIDSVNMQQLNADPTTISTKVNLINYYSNRLIIECDNELRERADETYLTAVEIFENYGAQTKTENIIEYTCADYDLLCGRYELAEKRLKALVDDKHDEMRFGVADALARCYVKQGRLDEAEEQLRKAVLLARNERDLAAVKRLEGELNNERVVASK